jgi:RNA polymerase sigma-70 factor, ECF subfamily
MGSVGFTLPWEHRISPVAREGESRVEPSELEAGQNRAGGTNPEDAALAAGCLARDLHAFEQLYRSQGARMKNLARNLLGTPSEAEDAVQETFLKVQRSIATYRGQSSFVTWVFRILVNTCHDLRRRRMRRKEQPREEPGEGVGQPEPRAPVAHPSLRLALERALAELTEHQRDVFLLFEVEGFRHAEIAGMLKISETASKNTLFQAKKNLRGRLEPPRSAAGGTP